MHVLEGELHGKTIDQVKVKDNTIELVFTDDSRIMFGVTAGHRLQWQTETISIKHNAGSL